MPVSNILRIMDEKLDLVNFTPSPTPSLNPGDDELQRYLTSHDSPSEPIPLLTLYTSARETAALPPATLDLFRLKITAKLQYETSIELWAKVLEYYCKDAEKYTRADRELRKCLAEAFYGKEFYEELDRNGRFARLKRKEERGWNLTSFLLDALVAAQRVDRDAFLLD
ncbi:MAG: hypothetical protein Q9180_007817 [Flavoplaca navasiana]